MQQFEKGKVKLEMKPIDPLHPRKVKAFNKAGQLMNVHRDYHDVNFYDRMRSEGWIFPDDYKTPEEKDKLDTIIAQRQAKRSADRMHRAAMSPQGRRHFEQMAQTQEVLRSTVEEFIQARTARVTPPPTQPAQAIAPADLEKISDGMENIIMERKPGKDRK